MSAYKTVYILLFLLKYAICPCTRTNLLDQLNDGMDISCKKPSYDESETCKIICTENNKIIKLNGFDSNAITVYCDDDKWKYYYGYYMYYEITPLLSDFECIDVTYENFCSFEHFDDKVLSVEDYYKGVIEDFYVTISCKKDENISMRVYCSSNELYTYDDDKFDEVFYRTKCLSDCEKNSLDNTLNKYSNMNNDCTLPAYSYGNYCNIYCTEKNHAFQPEKRVTSLKLVCEGIWKLGVNKDSPEILTEKMLTNYQCVDVKNSATMCTLDLIDGTITTQNKYLKGLVEGEQTSISCLHKQKDPMQLYCNSDGAVYQSKTDISLTNEYLREYCEVPCQISEVKKFVSEGVILNTGEKDVFEYGELFEARCSKKDAYFSNSNFSSKLNLQCKGKWYFEKEKGTLELMDSASVKETFVCKKGIYCDVETLKPFADFPADNKGLRDSQGMDITCKNNSNRQLTAHCNNGLEVYVKNTNQSIDLTSIEQYCDGVCETSLLHNTVLDLRPEIEFLAESQKLVLGCLHNKLITPMKVHCKSDSYFYEDVSDNKVTPEYAEQHCKGTCDVDQINYVVSYFEHKTGRVEENQKFDIPCRNGSSDSIAGGASVPTNMEVFCNKDGEFHGVESGSILTQSSLFDYCKVKCLKSNLLAYMDRNVDTDCGEETDYNEECSFYCEEEQSVINSELNGKRKGKLLCKGLWNAETALKTFVLLENMAGNIQCNIYSDTPRCSLGSIDAQVVTIEKNVTEIFEMQTIKATCVARSDIDFDIICSENYILQFAENDMEINQTTLSKKCRIGCSLERLFDMAAVKNFFPLTQKCISPKTNESFKENNCFLKCHSFNDWRVDGVVKIEPKILYCKDGDFHYNINNDEYKLLEFDDGIFMCEESNQSSCSIDDIGFDVVFNKTADEYRVDCEKGIKANSWDNCVL